MNSAEKLLAGLHTGFIDEKMPSSDAYQPHLLVNDHKRGKKVLTSILQELNQCDEFYFSVAFVTNSGVASLINVLKVLEEKGVKGKILASQYQNFTEPRALKRLLGLKNIELRIVTEGNFHAKGYLFKKESEYSFIIGSSNLTQNALSSNKEWNVKLSSMNNGALIQSTLQEFEYTFDNATVVSEFWIDQYSKIYQENRRQKDTFKSPEGELLVAEENVSYLNRISPNKMQIEALYSLENLRLSNKKKALLISATGTGKTYLSAFDVKNVNPKKFLFVVHRENIAKAAMKSYRAILGHTVKMGLLTGYSKCPDADYIFSTIQTLSKTDTLHSFKENHFDYIVIDEVHRSGANTYQKVLEHFQPEFMLGMSATPERTDGFDIFKAFDYNIAYEIRLNRALEEKMLSPFHYYGVGDIVIDGELMNELAAFNKLVCEERVNKIIKYAELYGCDRGRVKGLVFCSRVEEARELSEAFNLRGYKTIALDGSSSEDLREKSIERLEEDHGNDLLDYLFTVDIFNEGVDIPSVNQIIMLRPTQSAIVFVQQLGRGLRKCGGKEYLTVIDFIGNYSNNYLVPIALYGDNSYNKDSIRKLMNSGSSFIPGASTINFDTISNQKIYEAINMAKLSLKKDLTNDYKLLKYKLGKIPTMMDFALHGSRDPFAFVTYEGSYYAFVADNETEINGAMSPKTMKLLEFYSKEVLNGKRIEEVIILETLIEKDSASIEEIRDSVKEKYQFAPEVQTIQSAISLLNGQFFKEQDQQKYGIESSVNCIYDKLCLAKPLSEALENQYFKDYLQDAMCYAHYQFESHYTPERFKNGFILYQKYSRKDACRILGWEKDESSTIYGYRIKFNTCPIFVTYHKTDEISSSTKYEDHFINKDQFNWMTRNKVTLESTEVVQLKNHQEGFRISLFVKKSDGEGSDFYYMGDMAPMDFIQKTIKNDKGAELPIVNIKFKMLSSVDEAMMGYLEG